MTMIHFATNLLVAFCVVMVMQSRQQNSILQERFPVFAAQAKVCAENVTRANNISVR